MPTSPLVSIITVVYNGAKTLEQTIQSVLNQTYQNIEYIIIDGGSKDGTIDIIKKYEDTIAKWVSEPDEGLYDAMNKGIRMANGELIGLINSDDWYELDAVDIMVNAYIQHPTMNIFHADRFNVFTDNTKKIYKHNPSRLKFIYYGMTFNHPSMFITATEYKRHLYNTHLRSLSDYQFVLESYFYDSTKLHYIPTPIVNYRLDGISAQMNFFKALNEGFVARNNAGLHFLKNCISVIIRFITIAIYRVKSKLF